MYVSKKSISLIDIQYYMIIAYLQICFLRTQCLYFVIKFVKFCIIMCLEITLCPILVLDICIVILEEINGEKQDTSINFLFTRVLLG